MHGLETVCLRYFNVYGARQRSDSLYTGVITKFLTAARAGNPLTIYGDGSQSRDFIHVQDVAEANFAAASRDASAVAGRSFNIGSGYSVAVAVLASIIKEQFSSLPHPVFQTARSGEIMHSYADISLARGSLGFRPGDRLKQFLRDSVCEKRVLTQARSAGPSFETRCR